MQNIYITKHNQVPVTFDTPIVCTCFNQLDNTFFVSDRDNTIYQLLYDHDKQNVTLKETIPADPELVGLNIIDLTYLVDSQCLSVITREGSIFKVSASDVQLVAQNQDGLQVGSWSPSQDRLVLVTKNNTILQLNAQFNLDNEVPLNDQAQQGLGENARITWKPDGSFCCINFGVKDSTGRKCLVRDKLLNVFKSAAKPDPDPQGLVQSVSESPVLGLKQLVAWQPTANIIAGSDVHSQGVRRIVFWEKNGLRHLQFSLEGWVQSVNNISYSHDSEILYVQVETGQSRQLLLYRRANYHWYLKTAITLQEGDHYLLFKQRRNNLFILGTTRFESFEFSIKASDWEWKSSSEQQIDASCVHYSVDGSKLLVSDFGRSVIPPPFCLNIINTLSRILSTSKLQNSILVITAEQVCLYDYSLNKLQICCQNSIQHRLLNTSLISASPLVFYVGDIEYTVTDKTLAWVQKQRAENRTTVEIKGQEVEIYQVNNQLYVNQTLLCQETTSYCLYDVFLIFTVSTSELYQKLYVFNLQINDKVYRDTSPALLSSLQLSSLNMRNIQRGSKLVACTLGRCIFQLPRGNLQTIQPKIITLLTVKRLVEKQQYIQALETIRTHKLDMNLIFDLNPSQFISNTSSILCQIAKVDYISLIIASLKEGISDQAKYCQSKEEKQATEEYFQIHVKDKVKLVCAIISQSLREVDYQHYILAIVASQVKRGRLAEILHQIKVIKEKDLVIKTPPHLSKETQKKKKLNSKDILQYVCWMADPETVYRVAFLTFDLELVSMAAQFTQKDPKQYVPYLEQLKAIPDQIDRRARICSDLKQYPQAIRELARGNKQQKDQTLQMVKQQHLYRVGVESFRGDNEYLKMVRGLLGEYLESKEELNEAYNVYLTSGMLQKALELASKMFNVKDMLELMNQLKFSEGQIRLKMAEVISKLDGQPGDGRGLGRAYQYLGQYEQAAKVYIRSENFSRLNQILKRLPSHYILGEIEDGHKLIYSLKYNQTLSESKQFRERYARLMTVQKIKRATGILTIATKQADEMYSEYSRASSQSRSNYTVSTTTGIKKKRQKVKGILTRNVKEGSPLQQEYLVAVLNDQSIKAVDTIRGNKVVIQQLIYMNLLFQAESLRNETRGYSELICKRIRMYKEVKYEQEHDDITGVYPPYVPKVIDTISSFDYIL